jgi:hypothetical protein
MQHPMDHRVTLRLRQPHPLRTSPSAAGGPAVLPLEDIAAFLVGSGVRS